MCHVISNHVANMCHVGRKYSPQDQGPRGVCPVRAYIDSTHLQHREEQAPRHIRAKFNGQPKARAETRK